MNDFKFSLGKCDQCSLAPAHFGKGYDGDLDNCEVLLFGEAPGAMEEKTGLPFQGKSGQLLRRILKEVEFDMTKIVLSNVILCKPPENQTPSKGDISCCKENWRTLLTRCNPKLVILTGAPACHAFGLTGGITGLRGQVREWETGVRVTPVYHPAYILRKPGLENVFKDDLKAILRILKAGIKEEDYSDKEYLLIDSKEEVDRMEEILSEYSHYAVDIETTGCQFLGEERKVFMYLS